VADPWYPPGEIYFVDPREADDYPARQGDVFDAPEEEGALSEWKGFVLTHPTCELRKAPEVQIARIRLVSELPDPFQQALVTFGFRDRGGTIEVAYAHTFWLPPATRDGALSEPMFAVFRDVLTVDRGRVDSDRRARALSHEARLYLIRRKILFRYRWALTLDQVRKLEADRIRRDPSFEGPRPDWAAPEPGTIAR
jgi:hypothetical protein